MSVHGFDGNPPVLRHPRDLEGRGIREVEPQIYRFDALDRLLAQKTIEPHHHEAGRRLQGDWEIGSKTPCGSSQMMAGTRNGLGPSETKLAAMGRYAAAMASLGPNARDAIMAVVIRNEPMEFASTAARMDRRSFTGRLVAAIDQLAHHYGMCLTTGRTQRSHSK